MALAEDERLALALVELADTMNPDFDPAEHLRALARRGAELPAVAASGLVLSGEDGVPRFAAASDARAREVVRAELRAGTGPSLDCLRDGGRVVSRDLDADRDRWPGVAESALEAGFATAAALPMRLRDEVIGALTLFGAVPSGLDDRALRLGRALADMATIGILQRRARRESDLVTEQLRAALNSRVIIEQAKGVLAARHGIGVEAAFELLRRRARDNNLRLTAVAAEVVEGTAGSAPGP
ncbi:GAF and ANTAR domain-containing protein [Spirillospora sp. CA-294931]|uniref:GAF and ANTAR domain-containing protein n=1 Tax=Spirillospora sp. CA-294931 TaxID=3240042 RepID=UPI003D92D477